MALAVATAVAALVAPAPAPAAVIANDPGFALQWGLDQINAPAAWPTADGAGMTIAVIDSGADLDHEDLRFPDGRPRIVGSVSCIGSGGDPTRCAGSAQDDNGHGTHVAGIAAAATGNGKGVAGTAPGAKLLVVKALKQSCRVPDVPETCTATGTAADVEAGIRWAADRGATVINLSIGDDTETQSVLGPAFAEALRYAWDKGAIPVVAAGNDMLLSSGFSDEPAVVVSASARDRSAPDYSHGVGRAQWGIAAPGGEAEAEPNRPCGSTGPPNGILSTFYDAERASVKYACQAGTSMAAPHVSGALAILRSAGLRPQEAVDRLLATASEAGDPGRDSVFGAGIVDLEAAVQGLGVEGATVAPSPAPTAPPTEGQPAPAPTIGATVPATAPTTAAGPTPTIPPAPPTVPSLTGDTPTVAVPSQTEVALELEPVAAGDDAQAGGALVAVAVLAVAGAGGAHGWWWRRRRAASPAL